MQVYDRHKIIFGMLEETNLKPVYVVNVWFVFFFYHTYRNEQLIKIYLNKRNN